MLLVHLPLENQTGFVCSPEALLATGEEAVRGLLALDGDNVGGLLAKGDLCRQGARSEWLFVVVLLMLEPVPHSKEAFFTKYPIPSTVQYGTLLFTPTSFWYCTPAHSLPPFFPPSVMPCHATSTKFDVMSLPNQIRELYQVASEGGDAVGRRNARGGGAAGRVGGVVRQGRVWVSSGFRSVDGCGGGAVGIRQVWARGRKNRGGEARASKSQHVLHGTRLALVVSRPPVLLFTCVLLFACAPSSGTTTVVVAVRCVCVCVESRRAED